MFVAAFIAGSVFPWSSEAIMLGLQAAGLDPVGLVVWGTAGNVLGSMFNYWVGHLGRLDWIEKYLHVKKASLDRAASFMKDRGAWMGFFAFVPILGSAITIMLGLMHSNKYISLISMTLGKFLRYLLLAYGVKLLF